MESIEVKNTEEFVETASNELNKQDLVKMLYEDVMVSTDSTGHRLTKAAANRVLNAVLDRIAGFLDEEGKKVVITGFGTFRVDKSAARTGRNPRTGEAINIPERLNCKFKAGSGMKFHNDAEADAE